MEINASEKKEWEEFLSVISKNFRLILIFVALSCLAVVIITSLIPKQYISRGTIFPPASNALEDVIRNPQFGNDVEADRLIQLLGSRSIRDSITRKFHLVKYYNIDESDDAKDYQLFKKYNRDITFTRTSSMSVVISVRSKDPQMAADIVNEIIILIGKVRDGILKSNVNIAIPALEIQSKSLKSDLDSLGRVLDGLISTRKGIKQYFQMDKTISLILDNGVLSNDQAGQALQPVVNEYNTLLGRYLEVQNRLKSAYLTSKQPLPSVYVIENGAPNYKKSYPSYRINLMIAFAGSLVFITFLLFFIQKIRSFKSHLQ